MATLSGCAAGKSSSSSWCWSVSASWLTAHFGLSLALGAFIAGVVLSESEYSHQIVADIITVPDVFQQSLFISIGICFRPAFSSRICPWCWPGLPGLVLLKATIIIASLCRCAIPPACSHDRRGVGPDRRILFFILAKTIRRKICFRITITNCFWHQRFFRWSPRHSSSNRQSNWTGGAISFRARPVAGNETEAEASAEPAPDCQVIIIGYGLNGRNLAKGVSAPHWHSLSSAEMMLKLSVKPARKACLFFGDAVRPEVLHHIGVEHAKFW